MNKIIVLGCPGSGKSTFSIKLSEILCYPVLHLDKIYHIDNKNNIGREELMDKTIKFAENKHNWIIDGNYNGTIDLRIKLCDTIILFNIDTETCIQNILHRAEKGNFAMADCFDESIIDKDFIDFVRRFRLNCYPVILQKAKESKKRLKIFNDYAQTNDFLDNIDRVLRI